MVSPVWPPSWLKDASRLTGGGKFHVRLPNASLLVGQRTKHPTLQAIPGLGLGGGGCVMGDHQNAPTLLVLMAQQTEDDIPVLNIEIACGFVGQDQEKSKKTSPNR